VYVCRADDIPATPAELAQQMQKVQPKPFKSQATRYNDNRLAIKAKKETTPYLNSSQTTFSDPCYFLENVNKSWSVKHNDLLSQIYELSTNLTAVYQERVDCAANLTILAQHERDFLFDMQTVSQNNTVLVMENQKLTKNLSLAVFQNSLCIQNVSELTSVISELANNLTFSDIQYSLCTANMSINVQNMQSVQSHLYDVIQTNKLLVSQNSERVKNYTFLELQWTLCRATVSRIEQNETYLSVQLHDVIQNNTKLLSKISTLSQNLTFLELEWNTCADNMSELMQSKSILQLYISELIQNNTQCFVEIFRNKQKESTQANSCISQPLQMCNCTELIQCNVRNVQLTDNIHLCEHTLNDLVVNISNAEQIYSNISKVDDVFLHSENTFANLTLALDTCLVVQNVVVSQLDSCLQTEKNCTKTDEVCCIALAETNHLFKAFRFKFSKMKKNFSAKKMNFKIKQSNLTQQIDYCVTKKLYYIYHLRKYLTKNRVLNQTVELCRQEVKNVTETLNIASLNFSRTEKRLQTMSYILENYTLQNTVLMQRNNECHLMSLNATDAVQKLHIALDVTQSQIDYLSDIISLCDLSTNNPFLANVLRNLRLRKETLHTRQVLA
jgi:hypothetical protein